MKLDLLANSTFFTRLSLSKLKIERNILPGRHSSQFSFSHVLPRHLLLHFLELCEAQQAHVSTYSSW